MSGNPATSCPGSTFLINRKLKLNTGMSNLFIGKALAERWGFIMPIPVQFLLYFTDADVVYPKTLGADQ